MKKSVFTEAYEAPTLEILDIAVEQGFATSGDTTIDPWEDDGEVDMY